MSKKSAIVADTILEIVTLEQKISKHCTKRHYSFATFIHITTENHLRVVLFILIILCIRYYILVVKLFIKFIVYEYHDCNFT